MPSKTAEAQGVDGGGVTRFYPLYYVQRKHDPLDSCVHRLLSMGCTVQAGTAASR